MTPPLFCKLSKRLCINLHSRLFFNPLPVSYTHLDVYKRQGIFCLSSEAVCNLFCCLCRPFTVTAVLFRNLRKLCRIKSFTISYGYKFNNFFSGFESNIKAQELVRNAVYAAKCIICLLYTSKKSITTSPVSSSISRPHIYAQSKSSGLSSSNHSFLYLYSACLLYTSRCV